MPRTRREFLRSALGSAGWGALAGCATLRSCLDTIAKRPTRRNVNLLAANDPIIQAYQSAVTQMQALPSTDPRNWTNQARIHLDHCPHGNWLFLPWHRAYLLFFERICRKLSGMNDFALPYWNWTHDPAIPASFWGAGNPLAHPRSATPASVASASSVGLAVVDPILDETNFLLFGSGKIAAADDQRTPSATGRLEGTPHNYIHGFVGGDMGNYWSPLDPLFWLHHNMIERCWIEWNFARNHPNTNDPDWQNRTFTDFCDENGNPVSVTTLEGLLYPVFSYQFDSTALALATSSPQTWARVSGTGRTSEDARSEEDKAKAGAAVRLELLRSFPAPGPVQASAGRAVSVHLAVEPGALATARSEGGLRTLLRFAGAALDHSREFFVRVFVGKPDATPSTPETDPHFVSSFSFFEHGAHGDGMAPTFLLDAAPALRRLGIEGGDLEIQAVLTPIESGRAGAARLDVRSVDLRIVRDVVERAAK